MVRPALPFARPPKKRQDALRVGILGAASIAPPGIVWPAAKMADVVVVAVAARDEARAKSFAQRHGIPKVYSSYEALLADPGIDAIYIPLPNGLHFRWTVLALKAGKHVLCEKPLASNAAEVKEMITAAKAANKVLMEAFHYRFHPVAMRMQRIVQSGELGQIRKIETEGQLPWFFASDNDIRLNCGGSEPQLAGGALMDIGCYAVNCMRLLGGRPETVLDATASEAFRPGSGVDERMEARLRLPGGVEGRVVAGLRMGLFKDGGLFAARALVEGDRATLRVFNFLLPSSYHWIEVSPTPNADADASLKPNCQRRVEKLYCNGETTYELQLRAFADAVRSHESGCVVAGGPGMPGSAEDALENMEVIDEIYEKSRLGRRNGYSVY